MRHPKSGVENTGEFWFGLKVSELHLHWTSQPEWPYISPQRARQM